MGPPSVYTLNTEVAFCQTAECQHMWRCNSLSEQRQIESSLSNIKRNRVDESKHNTSLRCKVSQGRRHVSALYYKAIIRSDMVKTKEENYNVLYCIYTYRNLGNKLERLTQTQTKKPRGIYTFYPRVVNKTNITFTNNEINLLGLLLVIAYYLYRQYVIF